MEVMPIEEEEEEVEEVAGSVWAWVRVRQDEIKKIKKIKSQLTRTISLFQLLLLCLEL